MALMGGKVRTKAQRRAIVEVDDYFILHKQERLWVWRKHPKFEYLVYTCGLAYTDERVSCYNERWSDRSKPEDVNNLPGIIERFLCNAKQRSRN